MKKHFLFAALAGLMTFAACDSEETVVPEPPQQEETTEEPKDEPTVEEEDIFDAPFAFQKDISLGAAQQEISREMNKFAWKLFAKTFEKKEKANLMTSPYSLLQDLLMLSNGVEGETLEEIKTVLEIEEFSMEEVNQYILQFNEGLVEADPRTRYRTDNSIWYKDYLTIQPHFAENIAKYYKAETFPATMSIATLDSINQWTKERTFGRIPRFLDDLSDDTQAMLINTVYFRAKWTKELDEKKTEDGIFRNEDGREEPARMMPLAIMYLPYSEGDTYQYTYRTLGNQAYAMDFILPKEGVAAQDALAEYVEDMDGEAGLNNLKFTFPRFESESETELAKVLCTMGIERMFSSANSADFRLFDTGSFVGHVMQKTSITVDEQGTEAAAATEIEIPKTENVGGGSGKEPEYVIMTLDRPFFYAIRETSTNTPLFIGYQGSVAK